MKLAGVSRFGTGLVVLSAAAVCCGQGLPAVGAAAANAPSGMVQPAAASVQLAIAGLHVEKWKTSREMRDATSTNVDSMRRDLTATLPGLMTAADAAPDSVAAMLPLSRNLGALYDVLLRVTVVAESGAPREQTAALEQAMTSVEGARRTLANRLESVAGAQEQRVRDLQKAVVAAKAVAVAPCPPVAVPPKAAAKTGAKRTAHKKKKPVPSGTPAAKPAVPQG
jgi:hypothetical protein